MVIGVWDSGVDVDQFPGKLFINDKEKIDGSDTDGNGFVDDVNGIAYDVGGFASSDMLHPLGDQDGKLNSVFGYMQGFTDLHTIYLPPSRDIETLTERVALKIDSLRHSRNCAKVDLIGHSMGGIIARNYVQIRGGADKVDKCI